MRKTSKYSKEFTNEMTGRIAVVLAEEQNALTIQEIQLRDVSLVGITSQKMARMIGHLVDVGLVAKAKGKDGRMVYKCMATLEAEGVDTEPYKYGANMRDNPADFSKRYMSEHPEYKELIFRGEQYKE
jgi:hypothetical protein